MVTRKSKSIETHKRILAHIVVLCLWTSVNVQAAPPLRYGILSASAIGGKLSIASLLNEITVAFYRTLLNSYVVSLSSSVQCVCAALFHFRCACKRLLNVNFKRQHRNVGNVHMETTKWKANTILRAFHTWAKWKWDREMTHTKPKRIVWTNIKQWRWMLAQEHCSHNGVDLFNGEKKNS